MSAIGSRRQNAREISEVNSGWTRRENTRTELVVVLGREERGPELRDHARRVLEGLHEFLVILQTKILLLQKTMKKKSICGEENGHMIIFILLLRFAVREGGR